MGILILIFVLMVLYSLITNKKYPQENIKRSDNERIISVWRSKSLDDIIKETPATKNITFAADFLSGNTNMSATEFLSACVVNNIIDIRGNGIRYNEELLVVLDKLLIRSIVCRSVNDVVLYFFILYPFLMMAKQQMPESIERAADFIRKNGYNIYDSYFDTQRKILGIILHLTKDIELAEFNSALRYIFRVEGRLNKNDFLHTNKSAVGPYEEVIIKGHKLRFYSKPHLYFIDGIRIISVTQMLKEIDPLYANYDFVRRDVLMRAAARGTALHAEIQKYEEHGTLGSTQEFRNYLKIKEKHGFVVETCEQYVIIYYQNIPICVGRFDLLLKTKDNKIALSDIKRTSKYNKEDVTKQLNLYRIGYMKTYSRQVDEIYCLRLREEVAQYRPVDIDENMAQALLERYATNLMKNAKTYLNLLEATEYTPIH